METGVSALASNYRVAEDVVREALPNGLTALVKANHSAPVVAVLASVQVGYFHEPDRLNGIAHVIEHMLFKGTPQRPEDEQIAREVRALGGIINAGTYYEETSYYIVAPSRHLARVMEIQADTVQNPLFDAAELAKEIEVIVQESLQKRDNPTAMLIESLYALAFDRHRIRRWRIGSPETLRALTRDDLIQFVQQTYRPENIVLTIVGDVDTEQALALARQYWGDMPRGVFARETSPVEPARAGFRYRRMTGDTRQRLLLMGLPAPPILHPDAPALMVLSALLSDGRSARLFRRLKEELQIVNSAWASYEGFEQMGLFTLGAESLGDDPLPVERALWAEIDRIRHTPVAPEELERIKTRVESRRLYAQEEVLGVARTLATYEALGDYRLTDTMLERLRAVTAEDVRRVAATYLRLSQTSLLEYLPTTSNLPPERSAEEIESALRAEECGPAEAPALPVVLTPEPEPVFTASARDFLPAAQVPEAKALPLPGGGTLLYKRRRDLPLVSISALFRGGRRRETRANGGITNLMLKAGIKGTRSFTAEEIANRIEGLGSGIGMSLAPDYFGYGIKLRKDALREGFAVFGEVMAHPAFDLKEVEREKLSIYAEMRRQQDNNFSLAYDLFSAACYGEQHPYGLPASGVAEAIAELTPDDLRAWHAHHIVAENLVVGIVGDLEEAEAVALFAELLPARGDTAANDWGEAGAAALLTPEDSIERVTYRQKQQTAAVLGFPGASLDNEDRYALDLLSEIASGMGGRFFRAVRGENALAYQVTSFHRSRLDSGHFIAYTATSPENEERARDLILRECERLAQEPVSAEELASAKAAIVGEHVIGTQTYGAQAGELAAVGIYGLPLDEPQRYLARIEATEADTVRAAAERYLQPDRYWRGVVRGGASPESTKGVAAVG